MNIIIPLAGKDRNFESLGLPKPLTLVENKEIINWIAKSRPYSYEKATFIILREHQHKYQLADKLKQFFGTNIKIVTLLDMTDGSPQSILKARHIINNDEPLLIDLADQYLDLSGFPEFLQQNNETDGVIPSFQAYWPNQGYMQIDPGDRVTKVSEKDEIPISTHSTACISYFRKGSDFVKYAEQMISKKRTAANGAYLPSLVYNEMIEDNKIVKHFPIEFIAPLGTINGVNAFPQLNRPLKWKK
jgi:NDP-sugar pyrophosphorylase family protein